MKIIKATLGYDICLLCVERQERRR